MELKTQEQLQHSPHLAKLFLKYKTSFKISKMYQLQLCHHREGSDDIISNTTQDHIAIKIKVWSYAAFKKQIIDAQLVKKDMNVNWKWNIYLNDSKNYISYLRLPTDSWLNRLWQVS